MNNQLTQLLSMLTPEQLATLNSSNATPTSGALSVEPLSLKLTDFNSKNVSSTLAVSETLNSVKKPGLLKTMAGLGKKLAMSALEAAPSIASAVIEHGVPLAKKYGPMALKAITKIASSETDIGVEYTDNSDSTQNDLAAFESLFNGLSDEGKLTFLYSCVGEDLYNANIRSILLSELVEV